MKIKIILCLCCLSICGCATRRITYTTPDKSPCDDVNLEIWAGGYNTCYVTEVRLDEQVLKFPSDFSEYCPSNQTRGIWKGIVKRGMHNVAFVRNDGDSAAREVPVRGDTTIKINPSKADVFMETAGPILLGPIAIVTWPFVVVAMVLTGYEG